MYAIVFPLCVHIIYSVVEISSLIFRNISRDQNLDSKYNLWAYK